MTANLNLTPKPVKQRLVVSHSALPTKLPIIQYVGIYYLLSDRFQYPFWVDAVATTLLLFAVVGLSSLQQRETQVDIFSK